MKIIKDTNEVYHSHNSISASGLKEIYKKSVFHFLNRKFKEIDIKHNEEQKERIITQAKELIKSKDIVRSYSHEMIHHMQNLQGTLHNIQTQDTNADSALLELEKEAYLLGNITFRNWEDNLKSN